VYRCSQAFSDHHLRELEIPRPGRDIAIVSGDFERGSGNARNIDSATREHGANIDAIAA
jgi:hypothetical protein